MEALRIPGTEDIPEVIFDKENGIFELSGKSLPEEVSEFYTPVLKWIDDYQVNANDSTLLKIKLEYFNSASSKVIAEVLKLFIRIVDFGKKLVIEWHYPGDDEEMLEAGVEYSEILNFEFNYKSYEFD